MVGGNLRQAGVVAAAGIVALEEMIDRLAEDHSNAKALAKGLAALEPGLADPRVVETNIVNIDLSASRRLASEWASALKERGILVGPTSRGAFASSRIDISVKARSNARFRSVP